jgi:hypothetical protein
MYLNHEPQNRSTRQMPLFEKSSSRVALPCLTFKGFIQSLRVTTTPRGAFIADLKTLINAGVFPSSIYGWNDFYSFLAYHHRVSPDAVAMARKLWQQFKSKSQSTVPPVTTRETPPC